MKKAILLSIFITIISLPVFPEEFSVSGWFLKGDAETTDEGYILKNAELKFPGMYGGESLYFETIKLDKSRRLTETAFSDDKIEIMTRMGYKLKISEAEFAVEGRKGPGLYLNGEIIIHDGEDIVMTIPCGDFSFFLSSDWRLDYPDIKDVTGSYKGYVFTAESASTGNMFPDKRNTGFVLKNAKIEIPGMAGSVVFPLLSFYPGGGIGYAITKEPSGLSSAGFMIEYYSAELNEKGLSLAGDLRLAGLFDKTCSDFDELIIHPDGTFGDADLSVSVETDIGDTEISGRYMKMRDGKLITHDFRINFPESSGIERLYCTTVEIGSDGTIIADGDRFSLKDLKVSVERAALEGGTIVLSGKYAGCDDAGRKAEIESLFSGTGPEVEIRIHKSGLLESINLTSGDSEDYKYYETAEDDPARLLIGLTSRDENMLKGWVEHGYSVDVMSGDKPLLIDRIEDNDVYSIKWLLENGADPYCEYKKNNSMNYAIRKKNPEIPDLLLEYEFPLDRFSEYQYNPIKQTISNDRELTLKLLEHGAVLDEPDDVDVSFFDWARVWGDTGFLEKLESYGMKFTIGRNASNPYFSMKRDAGLEEKKEFAEYLKSRGISPNGHYGNEASTLEAYISYGYEEDSNLLASLLDYGDPRTRKGGSLLCEAVGHDLTSTALILIEKGASLTGLSDKGNSVYDVATAKNNRTVLDKMVAYGFKLPAEASGRFFKELNSGFIGFSESLGISGLSSLGDGKIITVLTKYNQGIHLVNRPVGSIIDSITGEYSFFDVDDIIPDEVKSDMIAVGDNRLFISTCIKNDTVSGYDLSTKVFDSGGNFIIESVLGTDEQVLFLDSVVYKENGKDRAKILHVNVSEDGENELSLVSINRFGILFDWKNLLKAERITDGKIIKTSEGFICACLKAGADAGIELVKLDEQFNILKKISIPVSGYNGMDAEVDSRGVTTILLKSFDNTSPCEIFIDADLKIIRSYQYNFPHSSDFSLLRHSGGVLLIASVPRTSNREFRSFKDAAGICIIAVNNEYEPLYQKYYPLTLPPADFSAGATSGGGLVVMTTALKDNYRGPDTACLEGIKLNEYAGGVEGLLINLETEPVELTID